MTSHAAESALPARAVGVSMWCCVLSFLQTQTALDAMGWHVYKKCS